MPLSRADRQVLADIRDAVVYLAKAESRYGRGEMYLTAAEAVADVTAHLTSAARQQRKPAPTKKTIAELAKRWRLRPPAGKG